MKKNINITIDEDIYNHFKNSGMAISTTINDFLINFIQPKKADIEEEQKKLAVIEFGKSLGLDDEFSSFTFENLDKDIVNRWKWIKNNFNLDFKVFKYIEIRNKFRAKFQEQKK